MKDHWFVILQEGPLGHKWSLLKPGKTLLRSDAITLKDEALKLVAKVDEVIDKL